MKPFLASCATFACTVVLAVQAHGYVSSLGIDPPAPVHGETVWVVAYGPMLFIQGNCVACGGAFCSTIDPHTFEAMACNYAVCPSGGCDCLSYPTEDFGELGRCELGMLAAGHYEVHGLLEDYPGSYSAYPLSFDVAAPVAVEGAVATRFRLQGLGPNPAHGMFRVAATLPTDAPAVVALYDVRGRLVTSVSLDGLGAGRHEVPFGEGKPLAAGFYVVRLTQGPHMAQVKELVLR